MSEITTPTSDRPSTQEPQTAPLTDDPVKVLKQIKAYYKVCWMCMAIGLPLSFLVIGGVVVLFGLIYGFHLFYLLWTLIPAKIARIDPEKAVWYSLIPFFNIYGVFVSHKGLAEDMNKTLQEHGIQYQVNEGLGLRFCVLVALIYIASPLIITSIVILLVAIVVWVLFLKSVKDGAIALLEQ